MDQGILRTLFRQVLLPDQWLFKPPVKRGCLPCNTPTPLVLSTCKQPVGPPEPLGEGGRSRKGYPPPDGSLTCQVTVERLGLARLTQPEENSEKRCRGPKDHFVSQLHPY